MPQYVLAAGFSNTRRAYVATAETGLRECREAVLATDNPALELPLAEVFE
jgi:hypothetical protein